MLSPHVNCKARGKMGTRIRFSTAQQRKPSMDRQLVTHKLKRKTGTVKKQRMR